MPNSVLLFISLGIFNGWRLQQKCVHAAFDFKNSERENATAGTANLIGKIPSCFVQIF